MVSGAATAWLASALLLAVEPVEPLIERLDPPRRAAVLMAILGLVLVGLTFVGCIMIGGRWLRRLARQQHGPTKCTVHVENRRLRAALEPILPTGEAGETAVARRKSDETVSDG